MIINEELAKKYPWGATKSWVNRTKQIAKFIPHKSSVVDVGGGFCHLAKYLDVSAYVSIDNQPWTDATIVADLNSQFPDLGDHQFIVCQGVMEYMREPFAFLKGIQKYGSRLILTYRLGKAGKQRFRNSLTFEQVESLLKKAGYEIVVKQWVVEKVGVQNEKLFYCVNTKYGQKR